MGNQYTIDAHCHLGQGIYGESLSPDKLIEIMDKNNVSRAIVFPFTPPDFDYRRANDYIAKAVDKFPDRLIGFARVDPRQVKPAQNELRRCIEELKLKGLKVHPFEQAFRINSEYVSPVFETCDELGIPVFTSAGAPVVSNPIQVSDFAEKHPHLKIIAAHCAQLDGSGMGQFDALNALKNNRNLFIDTSGYPETRKDGFYEQLLGSVGIERLVFGSDTPKMNQELELLRVTASRMKDSEIEGVLSKNLIKILELN